MVMDLKTKANDVLLEQRLGPKVAFPRHDVVKKLDLSLLDSTTTTSNVQVRSIGLRDALYTYILTYTDSMGLLWQ